MMGFTPDKETFRLFGRRRDRAFSPAQTELWERALPLFSVRGPIKTRDGLQALFPSAGDVRLEIGFGGAEHLIAQAEAHPNSGFIGAEPFMNGVLKALQSIEARGLSNIRILHGDARPFLFALPDACLSFLYILHPDPWPKTRHHKRRLIDEALLRRAASALEPAGRLRVCTDIDDYARWIEARARRVPSLQPEGARLPERPPDWPQTRYGEKAEAAGRPTAYFEFVRPAGGA